MHFAKILSMAALPLFLFACGDGNPIITPPSSPDTPPEPPKDSIPENIPDSLLKPITRDYSKIWTKGDGSAQNPYQISNEQELRSLAFYVNDSSMNFNGTYFKQTADIALKSEWTPIGIFGANAYGFGNRPFSGTYDGDSKTISGMKINDTASYSGLFGLARSAHITNVVLTNVNMDVGSYAGVLAGKVDSTTIENCIIAEIVLNGTDRVGGLVGEANYMTVANVSVEGIVTGENSVGGVVGRMQDGSIQNVTNKATVSGKSTVGGVVGGAASVSSESIFASALNYGAVSGSKDVGGVVATLSSTKLEKSGNYGVVTASESQIGNVGGVVAVASNKSVVNEVFNTGKVTATKMLAAGGVFGSLKNAEVTNVFNVGEVAGMATSLGGIAGIIDGNSKLESSFNAGVIPNVNYAGTVAGSGKSTIILTNVYYDNVVGDGCKVFGGDAPFGIELPAGFATADIKAATFVATLNGTGNVWSIDPAKFDGYPSFSWAK